MHRQPQPGRPRSAARQRPDVPACSAPPRTGRPRSTTLEAAAGSRSPSSTISSPPAVPGRRHRRRRLEGRRGVGGAHRRTDPDDPRPDRSVQRHRDPGLLTVRLRRRADTDRALLHVDDRRRWALEPTRVPPTAPRPPWASTCSPTRSRPVPARRRTPADSSLLLNFGVFAAQPSEDYTHTNSGCSSSSSSTTDQKWALTSKHFKTNIADPVNTQAGPRSRPTTTRSTTARRGRRARRPPDRGHDRRRHPRAAVVDHTRGRQRAAALTRRRSPESGALHSYLQSPIIAGVHPPSPGGTASLRVPSDEVLAAGAATLAVAAVLTPAISGGTATAAHRSTTRSAVTRSHAVPPLPSRSR